MRHPLLLIAIFALSPPLFAEETPWYDVEAVIFAQPAGADLRSEAWPERGERPDLSGAVRLDGGAVQTAAGRFTPLKGEHLDDTLRRLERNGYRILAKQAWRQPGLARQETVPVAIETEQLAGTLRLTLSRFLHLEAKLAYAPDGWGAAYGDGTDVIFPWQSVVTVYPLHEERRMRSRELHYLDNPALGLIVAAWPYQPPTPEPEPVEVPPESGELPAESAPPDSTD